MNIGNMAKVMNDVHGLIDAIIQTAASEGEEGREDYSLDLIRMQNELREKYAALQQELAAAREVLALFIEFDDAGEPPGDVCFEKARATLQRDRQP